MWPERCYVAIGKELGLDLCDWESYDGVSENGPGWPSRDFWRTDMAQSRNQREGYYLGKLLDGHGRGGMKGDKPYGNFYAEYNRTRRKKVRRLYPDVMPSSRVEHKAWAWGELSRNPI